MRENSGKSSSQKARAIIDTMMRSTRKVRQSPESNLDGLWRRKRARRAIGIEPAFDESKAISHGSFWVRFRWLPIRSINQVVFAEAFSQGVAAGIEFPEAIAVAAFINPCPWFRRALFEMAKSCESGYSLERSLAKTRARVNKGLPAALQVGEHRGNLSRELSVFAHQLDPKAGAHLIWAAGRSPEVVRFAGALSRLLHDHRLTPDLIEDAGRTAARGKKSFLAIIRQVVRSTQNGETLGGALAEHREFDFLFCRCVGAATSREEMQSVLARLAGHGQSF